MTPAARVQAAIDCLDRILAGAPAEQELTGWARRSRFAGAKDRAAIRDHVFDALRCRRSFAALGGAETGRGLMLGALRSAGLSPDELFSGAPYAPEALSEAELAAGRAPAPGAEAGDVPDWVWPLLEAGFGAEAAEVAEALRSRSAVHLRVNTARTTLEEAQAALAEEGIATRPHSASPTALEITEGARRLRNSQCYLDGRVELQDAASQAIVDALPLRPGMKVLDYCAGGGGKTLAVAARGGLSVFAHDAAAQRLRDLPARAERAGAKVRILTTGELEAAGPFDIVLCDVPCSGSGAWRRSPDGKWRLTPETLAATQEIQRDILSKALKLVKPDGLVAYATCSILPNENDVQVQRVADGAPGWSVTYRNFWDPREGTDGFFSAHLQRR